MSLHEREIQRMYRESLTPQDPAPDCPSADAIWDAVTLAMSADQRAAIVTHMSGCASCAFTWQAAMEVREPAADQQRPPVRNPSRWLQWLRPPVLAPLAGAMAAALVLMVWLQGDHLPTLPAPPAEGVVRGFTPPADTTQPSPSPLSLSPGERLTWSPIAGAQAYRLVLFNPQSKTVSLYPESTDSYRLEPELKTVFDTDEQVYWFVEAIDGEQPGARSQTASFMFSAVDG